MHRYRADDGVGKAQRNLRELGVLNIDAIDETEFYRAFKFHKDDLYDLQSALLIPSEILSAQRVSVSGTEALCMTLRRLAYSNWLCYLEQLFNRHSSAISSIVSKTMAHMEYYFAHLLYDLTTRKWLDLQALELFSKVQAESRDFCNLRLGSERLAELQARAAKAQMQRKRDENVPPEDIYSEIARSQLSRPVGTSALSLRELNTSPQSSHRVTGKDRLQLFCGQVFRGTATPPPVLQGQESPQLASADCTKPKPASHADADRGFSEAPTPGSPVHCQQPSSIARATREQGTATVSTGHFHTGQASSKAGAASECPVQHQQPSGIPRATTSRPGTYKAGGDCRVLHSTPNVSPGLQASLAATDSHETDGTTYSADTSTSSGVCCVNPPLVPDMLSPDFDKFRELLHQDRIECCGRDFTQSPVSAVSGQSSSASPSGRDDLSPALTPPLAVPLPALNSVHNGQQIVEVPFPGSPADYNDLSPALTPPLAVPLPALNSVHNGQQIVAVPFPGSPADYTDSLEGSSTAEFQLPASVVWKRQHGQRWSSATPPRVSPGSRIRHAEESPRQEERDSSGGGGVSGSSTSRGDGSPGAIASGFRTPDVDNFCHRVRAEIAESYGIFPQLSPAQSFDSIGTDVEKHHSMSPLLSPANSIKAADDLSPALTPPLAVPLPALNSVHNGQQIVAVPFPGSPADYTDSLEGSSTAEFQLPASVVWKRQHGQRWSSATPPRVSPGSRIRHAEESPRQEERDSSGGGGVSGSSTSRGDGSPGAIASGFRTPDVDNFCHRVRAEIAESYGIFPQLSPAQSFDSIGTDVEKHHSMSPLLSPANSIKAADDLSPALTPPLAVPLPALNSVHNGQQIVAVPFPGSPADYTDSLEGSSTAEFQLPASVVWKRQHGQRWSSATPPRVSPGSRIRHAEESPRQEEGDSSGGGGVSSSSTSRGDGSPGAIASGFRTPDVDNFCHHVRAEIAESYGIFPQLSPAQSFDSIGTDVEKHHRMSPLLSPANSIKAAGSCAGGEPPHGCKDADIGGCHI